MSPIISAQSAAAMGALDRPATAAAGGSGPAGDAGKVAEAFEAILLERLIGEMRTAGEGGEGLFGSGPGAGILEGFFDNLLAEHIAATGSLRILPGEVIEGTVRGKES